MSSKSGQSPVSSLEWSSLPLARISKAPPLEGISVSDLMRSPSSRSLATKILELGERIKSLTLIPSSGGAFEVRANGKLLHSKLDSGDWPDFDDIVKAIKKAK